MNKSWYCSSHWCLRRYQGSLRALFIDLRIANCVFPALERAFRPDIHKCRFQLIRRLDLSKYTPKQSLIVYAGVSSHICPQRGFVDVKAKGVVGKSIVVRSGGGCIQGKRRGSKTVVFSSKCLTTRRIRRIDKGCPEWVSWPMRMGQPISSGTGWTAQYSDIYQHAE